MLVYARGGGMGGGSVHCGTMNMKQDANYAIQRIVSVGQMVVEFSRQRKKQYNWL